MDWTDEKLLAVTACTDFGDSRTAAEEKWGAKERERERTRIIVAAFGDGTSTGEGPHGLIPKAPCDPVASPCLCSPTRFLAGNTPGRENKADLKLPAKIEAVRLILDPLSLP